VGESLSALFFLDFVANFEGRMFFLAAAEDTSNAYDDGAIVGTVFGEFSPQWEVQVHGFLRGEKAEGLAVYRHGDQIGFDAVTDNDDPSRPSELLRSRLEA
jgi:hypothetical protein